MAQPPICKSSYLAERLNHWRTDSTIYLNYLYAVTDSPPNFVRHDAQVKIMYCGFAGFVVYIGIDINTDRWDKFTSASFPYYHSCGSDTSHKAGGTLPGILHKIQY